MSMLVPVSVRVAVGMRVPMPVCVVVGMRVPMPVCVVVGMRVAMSVCLTDWLHCGRRCWHWCRGRSLANFRPRDSRCFDVLSASAHGSNHYAHTIRAVTKLLRSCALCDRTQTVSMQ